MSTVLIVIHLMVVLALIGLVLLQRSEGGALGIGGSGGVMSGRGAGNMLTRTTGVLAAVFFLTSVGLSLLARMDAGPSDILDRLPAGTTTNAPAPSAPMRTPTNAQDLLQSLGGPQAPPSDAGVPAPSAELPVAPQPAPAEPLAPVAPTAPVTPASPPAAPAVPAPTSPPSPTP